jgi:hypothetical protein
LLETSVTTDKVSLAVATNYAFLDEPFPENDLPGFPEAFLETPINYPKFLDG